ncbi:MAG TPA: threonine synthase, partial [Thermoanaerobaculia bacterium]|nr:threonine synthase [Thermoanaerobaculia bacterium]
DASDESDQSDGCRTSRTVARFMTFERALACSSCGWSETIRSLRNLCPLCGSPLLVRYELDTATALREAIRCRSGGMWRYRELLPAPGETVPVTLGEGSTPLLRSSKLGALLGLDHLYIKDESQNPTRSFKARGMSAAVTMARALGAQSLAVPTAGNAGVALAAYAARAHLPAYVAMPEDTPRSIADACRAWGAEVELVPGLITDAAARVRARVAEDGAFDLSTLREPYRVEGKKIMGYELLEDLGRLPDVILYPTGGGTGLIGMVKAFDEMERLGWIGKERPRMIAVQSSGCAPIVRAFEQGLESAPEWESPRTKAWGLRVPRALGDRLMLRALRDTGGGAVAVEEENIAAAAADLRSAEGIDAGPEGGAALLALRTLIDQRRIALDDVVVLFNTGADLYRD